MTEKLILIGTFELESELLLTADPLCSTAESLTQPFIRAKTGPWNAYISQCDLGKGYIHVTRLVINNPLTIPQPSWITLPVINAQSGMAGFFDLRHFRQDMKLANFDVTAAIADFKAWGNRLRSHQSSLAQRTMSDTEIDAAVNERIADRWHLVCHQAEMSDHMSGTMPHGVICRSGMGHGSYPVHARVDDSGAVVLAVIDFGPDGLE